MKRVIFAIAMLGFGLGGCGEPLSEHEEEIRKIELNIAANKKETKRLEKAMVSLMKNQFKRLHYQLTP